MTFELQSEVLTGRTVGEWDVVVSNIIEEVKLILI